MNLATDFNYLAVTVDKSREYIYRSPIKYKYGVSDEAQWRHLYPISSAFEKELMRFPIVYKNFFCP